MDAFQYKHISSTDANTTVTVIANSPVLLHAITINTTSAHALTVNNFGASGTDVAAVTKASIIEQQLLYDVVLEKGMTITVPSGYVGDATIAFKPL